jgi:hypothetical protein
MPPCCTQSHRSTWLKKNHPVMPPVLHHLHPTHCLRSPSPVAHSTLMSHRPAPNLVLPLPWRDATAHRCRPAPLSRSPPGRLHHTGLFPEPAITEPGPRPPTPTPAPGLGPALAFAPSRSPKLEGIIMGMTNIVFDKVAQKVIKHAVKHVRLVSTALYYSQIL